MKRIEILSVTDRAELYRTCPKEEDSEHLISDSCELFYDGKKWATFISQFSMEPLRNVIRSIDDIGVSRRQTGVPSFSRTFGFMPRAPVQQRDYCYASTLQRDYPKQADVLFHYAKVFSNLLGEHYPEKAALSNQALGTVKPEWTLPGSLFTSGIINQDNPLQYHYDAGNFEGTYSVMAVFKEQVTGGHLVLPEYNVKLACQDSSILIFDGQSELHGVSPIRKMSPEAYRFSIVYYSLEQLCKCGTRKEEIRRAQISRTKTEMKRAGITK